MNEGGQSSTGQLIDFVMTTHAAYPRLEELAKKSGKSTYELLGEQLDKMQEAEKAETRSESGPRLAGTDRSASHKGPAFLSRLGKPT